MVSVLDQMADQHQAKEAQSLTLVEFVICNKQLNTKILNNKSNKKKKTLTNSSCNFSFTWQTFNKFLNNLKTNLSEEKQLFFIYAIEFLNNMDFVSSFHIV